MGKDSEWASVLDNVREGYPVMRALDDALRALNRRVRNLEQRQGVLEGRVGAIYDERHGPHADGDRDG